MRQIIALTVFLVLFTTACQKSSTGGEGDSTGGPGQSKPGHLSENQIQDFLRGSAMLNSDLLAMRSLAKMASLGVQSKDVAQRNIDTVLRIELQNGLYSIRRK